MINWDLMREPYNWVIVALMLTIAGLFLVAVNPSTGV